MKKFDVGLKTKQNTFWKSWPLYPSVAVKFARTTRKEMELIIRSCEILTYKQHQPIKQYDTDKFIKKVFGTVILDWSGVYKDGVELEFNEENFMFVCDNFSSFNEFIQGVLLNLDEFCFDYYDSEEEKQLIEKNS